MLKSKQRECGGWGWMWWRCDEDESSTWTWRCFRCPQRSWTCPNRTFCAVWDESVRWFWEYSEAGRPSRLRWTDGKTAWWLRCMRWWTDRWHERKYNAMKTMTRKKSPDSQMFSWENNFNCHECQMSWKWCHSAKNINHFFPIIFRI